MLAFGIWALFSMAVIFIGISCFWKKKPVGIWANAKAVSVKEDKVKDYNRAFGKLICAGGVLFLLLGLPLLCGQNSPWVFLSVFGCAFECIVLMAVSVKIEEKYRKRESR